MSMPASVWQMRTCSGTPPPSIGGVAGNGTSLSPLRATTSQRTHRAPRSSCDWLGVNSVQVRIEVRPVGEGAADRALVGRRQTCWPTFVAGPPRSSASTGLGRKPT